MNNEIKVNFNFNELESLKCEKCECPIFNIRYTVKKLPSIYTESGKEELYPLPLYICENCEHINEMFFE